MIRKFLFGIFGLLNFAIYSMEQMELDLKNDDNQDVVQNNTDTEKTTKLKRKNEVADEDLSVQLKKQRTNDMIVLPQEKSDSLSNNETLAALPAELRFIIMQNLIHQGNSFKDAITDIINFAFISKDNHDLFENNLNNIGKLFASKYGLLPILSKEIPKEYSEFNRFYSDEAFMKNVQLGSNFYIDLAIQRITKNLEILEELNKELNGEWINWLGIDFPIKIKKFKGILLSIAETVETLTNDFLLEEILELRLIKNFKNNIILSKIDSRLKQKLAYEFQRVLEAIFSVKSTDKGFEILFDRRHQFDVISKVQNSCKSILDVSTGKFVYTLSTFPQSDPFKIKKRNLSVSVSEELNNLLLKIDELERISKARTNSWTQNLASFYIMIKESLKSV